MQCAIGNTPRLIGRVAHECSHVPTMAELSPHGRFKGIGAWSASEGDRESLFDVGFGELNIRSCHGLRGHTADLQIAS